MPYKRVRNAAYWREYRKQKRQEMANKFPKKTPKTAAQRQRECRNRKKLAMLATSAAGNSGNVPETAAQHETECRKRLDMLAASVVDSSGNVPKTAAQRQRECRNRKKLAMLGISVVGNSGSGPKTAAQRQRECRTRKKLAAIINNARVTNENGTSIQWMQEGKVMCYADNNLVERRSCTSFPAVVLHHNMDIVEVTPDLSSMNIVKEEPDANNESESEYSQGADQFYDVKKEKEGNEDEEHLRDSQAGEENNMEEVKLEPYLEVKTEQSPTFNSYNFDNDVKIQDTERQEEYEMGSIKEDPLMINSDANEGINEYASVSIKETEKPLLKNEIKEEVWESLDVKEEIKCEIMKDDLQQNRYADNDPDLSKFESPCGHKEGRYKCGNIPAYFLLKAKKMVYSVPKKVDQDRQLSLMMKVSSPKSQKPGRKLKRERKKNIVVKYEVETGDQKQPVCAKFFKKFFVVGQTRINTIAKRIKSGEGVRDKRGGNRKADLYAQKKNKVIQFIKKLQTNYSHYGCNKSQRLYLSADLNINTLFKLYNSKVSVDLKVKKWYFHNIFRTQFNIGFGSPATDVYNKLNN